MPYKDLDKRRAVVADSVARHRQAARDQVAHQEEVQEQEFPGRPQVEDAESAFGDLAREASIAKAVNRRYGKSRTWACIMYEDSAPPDWEDRLRQIGVGFAVSPLHDKDVTQTGELKKPHYHVILDWKNGSTTYRTAAGIARDVLRGTVPIPLASPRGYYRYMTHLDNPEKAQYDPRKIISGNGFDIDDFSMLTAQEQSEVRRHIVEDLIVGLSICEYLTLTLYCDCHESPVVADYVAAHTVYFCAVLSSHRHGGAAAVPDPPPPPEKNLETS